MEGGKGNKSDSSTKSSRLKIVIIFVSLLSAAILTGSALVVYFHRTRRPRTAPAKPLSPAKTTVTSTSDHNSSNEECASTVSSTASSASDLGPLKKQEDV
jgi:hypothetical protein